MNKNTIRNRRNSIFIDFSEHYHGNDMKGPHQGKWISIIRFLRKRGFTVTENPTIKEHYNCLSKFHRIGFKKEVALLMEISGHRISVEFGNIQNLWKDMAQSFWSDPSDDRYTKLTYLQNKAVQLEIVNLMEFCKKFNLEFLVEHDKLLPEAYILNKLKINPHIHGKVESLNDIKKSIDVNSYNYIHNSNDKNKKKIICGDKKYFYDYRTKRLSCGIAWHNINNMWWVIINDEMYNKASFELFDYMPGLPKREPVTESKIEKLLAFFQSKRDYKRCMHINHYANKLFPKVVTA